MTKNQMLIGDIKLYRDYEDVLAEPITYKVQQIQHFIFNKWISDFMDNYLKIAIPKLSEDIKNINTIKELEKIINKFLQSPSIQIIKRYRQFGINICLN